MTELTKRVIVGIFGIPALLGLSYLGGYYFFFLLVLINGMALWEFYTMFEKKEIYAYKWTGIMFGTLFMVFMFFNTPLELAILFFISVLTMLLMQVLNQDGTASVNSSVTVTGFLYISIFLSAMLKLRLSFADLVPGALGSSGNPGGVFLIILWVSIWICDTAAYSGGRKLGKHKLAPNVSPNKTVEGAVFGFIFGIATFVLMGYFLLPAIPIKYFWICGLIVSVFGQLGDLVESRFKRDAGVKDTSPILPGHGGFLDRFDSLIFVSPFLYGLFYLF
jgi:phosphatidate cytidylyltransferase